MLYIVMNEITKFISHMCHEPKQTTFSCRLQASVCMTCSNIKSQDLFIPL